MAEVHNNQDLTRGIKLFGKTISLQERKVKDEEEPAVKVDDQNTDKRPDKVIACPRCKSMETKFCYFNNYNVNQPRHFCRGCQRYWTAGGALRDVPVGAGRRKTKSPCRGLVGFQEGCGGLFDLSSGIRQFDIDGMVEEWHMAAAAAAQVDFRHFFPVKRRRSSISGGESC